VHSPYIDNNMNRFFDVKGGCQCVLIIKMPVEWLAWHFYLR